MYFLPLQLLILYTLLILPFAVLIFLAILIIKKSIYHKSIKKGYEVLPYWIKVGLAGWFMTLIFIWIILISYQLIYFKNEFICFAVIVDFSCSFFVLITHWIHWILFIILSFLGFIAGSIIGKIKYNK